MFNWLQGHTNEHQRCQENLSAYIDEQLTARERARLEAHLQSCAQCRADLASLRQTVALLRLTPAVRVPYDFRIRPDTAGAAVRPPARPLYVYLRAATAVVAALLVVTLSGDWYLRNVAPQRRTDTRGAVMTQTALANGGQTLVAGTGPSRGPIEPTASLVALAAPGTLEQPPVPSGDGTVSKQNVPTEPLVGLEARPDPSRTYGAPAAAPSMGTMAGTVDATPIEDAPRASAPAPASPDESTATPTPAETPSPTPTSVPTATPTVTPTLMPTVTTSPVGQLSPPAVGAVVPAVGTPGYLSWLTAQLPGVERALGASVATLSVATCTAYWRQRAF